MSGNAASLITHRRHTVLLLCLLVGVFTGCSAMTDESSLSQAVPPARAQLRMASDAPIAKPPAPTLDDIQGKAEKWFFGQGVGQTMTNIGSVVLFPPYALYLIGNAALSLSGLQPIYVSDLLPDESRAGAIEAYDAFTSVPGRITSSIAGREFEKK